MAANSYAKQTEKHTSKDQHEQRNRRTKTVQNLKNVANQKAPSARYSSATFIRPTRNENIDTYVLELIEELILIRNRIPSCVAFYVRV